MKHEADKPQRPDPADPTEEKSLVVMKIPRAEKGAWVRQSRKEGKKLVEWIRERCRVDNSD